MCLCLCPTLRTRRPRSEHQRLLMTGKVTLKAAMLRRGPEGTGTRLSPSAEEVARHRLTRLPYRRWCRFCVMARCRNEPHRKLPAFSRAPPLVCTDYCCVQDSRDQSVLTLMVGRLYPDKAICVIPCDVKGPDP